MASATTTFAGHLRHFAKSVDIVNDAIFEGVRKLVYKYVRTELRADYFELLREWTTDDGRGLATFWSSDDKHYNFPIRDSDGRYTSLLGAALDLNKPLWIVSPDKLPVTEGAKREEQWSKVEMESLPSYQPAAGNSIRTVVVVPLRRRRVIGCYYLETSSYVGITEVAKAELLLLGDALAILFDLWDHNNNQSRMSQDAIFDLDELLKSARFPRLAKPSVFVAYSVNADSRVVTALLEVLDGYSDKLEITDWVKMGQAGNINNQILKQIKRSKFGVCYLSEPAATDLGGPLRYTDSENVVFEAGMLQALTEINAEEEELSSWLPIREDASPQAPFDFAAQRILHVPRMNNGELNEQRFKDMLKTQLSLLLNAP
jgi:hypothetical protein